MNDTSNFILYKNNINLSVWEKKKTLTHEFKFSTSCKICIWQESKC